MSNLYDLGKLEFFTKLAEALKKTREAFRVSGFFVKCLRPFPSGRLPADEFFTRTKEIKECTKKPRLEKNDHELIESEKWLHLGRCLEQDFKYRYTCGRNHAVATSLSELWRLEVDVPIIHMSKE